MVLQALVVKKIDDLYGVKINTDSNIPISEGLLKQFGISTAMLNTITNASEKRQYIADTMSIRISLMIKEWDEKQNQRQTKLKSDVKLQQKEENRKLEQQVDMFDWLKIGTNHDQLQKKLRMSIIEKLTDPYSNHIKQFENQEEIAKMRVHLQQQQQTGNKQSTSTKQKLEIHLKTLPFVSTKVLLLRMDEKHNKYLKEGMTKEQLKQFEEINHDDYMNETKKNPETKQQVSSSSQKANMSSSNQHVERGDELPEWNEELEKQFLSNKKAARMIYGQDISSSSWNQQAYLPLVQEYNLSNKKKIEREQLITNYQGGVWLTEKELKFIADTSSLLNKCIKKDYVQKIVNNISKDDVGRLELSLAENIITNYENMQNLIMEQRQKFLRERQSHVLRERDEARKNQILKEQKEKELKVQRRYVKMFKTIGGKLLSSKTAYIQEIFQKNFFCRLFFEKVRDIVRKYRKRREYEQFKNKKTEETVEDDKLAKQLANQKLFVQRLAKAETQRKICGVQHELHPPSKISYFAPSDEPTDPKREELINFMIDRYQLTIKSKQEVRIKENFQKYYSGGPQKSEISENNNSSHIQKLQLTKKQFSGIIRVQRLFRQFRMRKLIRNMKEQEFSIKSTIYRDKLKSYMTGRAFLKIAQKKTGKDLIPVKNEDELNIQKSDAFSSSIYSSDDEQGQQKDRSKGKISNKQTASKRQTNRSNQGNIKIDEQYQLGQRGSVKDEKYFYHITNTFGPETLSTDRINVGSKTADDDFGSKLHNTHSTYKFLSNDRYDTRSNEGDEDNSRDSDSPKTKQSDMTDSNQIKKSVKDLNNEDKPFPSFSKFAQKYIKKDESLTEGSTKQQTSIAKTYLTASMVNLLTPKSLRYNPKLLLKQQKLLIAAKTNNFLMIRDSNFILNEADANCKDADQNTPLIYAIRNQNIVFIRWLVCKGGNIDLLCSNANTPVHEAFKTNNPNIIHDILLLKPNLSAVNAEGFTPLGYASAEILAKFNLQDNSALLKTDTSDHEDNNNQSLGNLKNPLKRVGKAKINNFHTTTKQQNFTLM